MGFWFANRAFVVPTAGLTYTLAAGAAVASPVSADYFRAEQGVVAAYWLGSVARGTAHGARDVQIGVLCHPPPPMRRARDVASHVVADQRLGEAAHGPAHGLALALPRLPR